MEAQFPVAQALSRAALIWGGLPLATGTESSSAAARHVFILWKARRISSPQGYRPQPRRSDEPMMTLPWGSIVCCDCERAQESGFRRTQKRRCNVSKVYMAAGVFLLLAACSAPLPFAHRPGRVERALLACECIRARPDRLHGAQDLHVQDEKKGRLAIYHATSSSIILVFSSPLQCCCCYCCCSRRYHFPQVCARRRPSSRP